MDARYQTQVRGIQSWCGALMLRAANCSDAEQIAALVNKAYRPNSTERGWTHEAQLVSGSRTSTDHVAKLIKGDGIVLIACDGSLVIGCVHIEEIHATCYIGMLATSPSEQNKGLGKNILSAAEALAVYLYGTTCFKMSVLSNRPELLAYYERRGYQPTGATRPYPVDAGFGSPRAFNLQVLELEKRALPRL